MDADRTPYDARELLERHVEFELARWRGEELERTLAEEAAAWQAWLGTVTVGDLAPAEETARAVARLVATLAPSDEVVELTAEAVVAGRAALAETPVSVTDAVPREEVEQLAEVVGGMEDLRGTMIAAVTATSAYRSLVARVLYQGIKSYLLSDNPLARRIPGASSLVRLGQRSINTAAPGLESAVDRQLTAFVSANISETLGDSRHYLEQHLDADTLRELLDEAWAAAEGRQLGDLASVVADDEIRALVTAAGPLARHVLGGDQLAVVVEGLVTRLLEQHADLDVAGLLDRWGVDLPALVPTLADAMASAHGRAEVSGFLEARLRARLEPFYASLTDEGPAASD